MTKIQVPVLFHGTIEVEVPDELSVELQGELAKHIALSRVLATMENPDAPEFAACEDLKAAYADITDDHWDESIAHVVCGTWEARELDDSDRAHRVTGIEIDSYYGDPDNVAVVHVDTPGLADNDKGPIMRLYINDENVYENPPYPKNPPERIGSAGSV